MKSIRFMLVSAFTFAFMATGYAQNNNVLEAAGKSKSGSQLQGDGLGKSAIKKGDSFSVSRQRIELSPEGRADYFAVTNTSAAQDYGFAIEVYRWSQEGGKDRLMPTKNLLVTPRTFVLAPGAYKNIRLMISDTEKGLKDYSYRIFLKQISRTNNGAQTDLTNTALKVDLQVSVPVFFSAEKYKDIDQMSLVVTGPGEDGKTLDITNEDSQYILLKEVRAGENKSTYGWYVLPGSSQTMRFKETLSPQQLQDIQISGDRRGIYRTSADKAKNVEQNKR